MTEGSGKAPVQRATTGKGTARKATAGSRVAGGAGGGSGVSGSVRRECAQVGHDWALIATDAPHLVMACMSCDATEGLFR